MLAVSDSLPSDISGPGSCPAAILAMARRLVYPATRSLMTMSASCWRISGSSALPTEPGRLDEPGRLRQADTAAPATDGRPLVHQRGEGHRPAAVHLAEPMGVGDPDVGEEHLVERGTTGHLAQRTDLHTGCVHVDDESGQSAVLGQVGVGAADDLADVGHLGARGPHLLAVEDPLVAVPDRPGLQRGQVRSRRRLAEQLAAHDVAPPHLAQVGLLHLVGGMGQDRRGHHAEADAVDRQRRRPVVRRPPGPRSAGSRRCRPRPPYSVGPVIQPKPASKTFWAQARDMARSASCCSGDRSGKRLTLSDPWPHTKTSSGRFSALASRNARASASNSSGVGAPRGAGRFGLLRDGHRWIPLVRCPTAPDVVPRARQSVSGAGERGSGPRWGDRARPRPGIRVVALAAAVDTGRGIRLRPLAALANALSAIFQRIGVQNAPADTVMSIQLIRHAFSNAIWFAGLAMIVVGFLLQAGALHFGQLSSVQPMVTTELLFLVLILGVWFRYHLAWREWGGSLAAAGGLATFLVAAAPGGGDLVPDPTRLDRGLRRDRRGFGRLSPLGLHRARWFRAAMFGSSGAVVFALSAALTKQFTTLVSEGWGHVFTDWVPYALVATGVIGLFLIQSSFHAGPVTASQAAITIIDPIVSVVLGIYLFHDRLDTAGWRLPGRVGGRRRGGGRGVSCCRRLLWWRGRRTRPGEGDKLQRQRHPGRHRRCSYRRSA